MNDHEAAPSIGIKTPRRRSLWLTLAFSILAVAALVMAFSQNTLTAPMPDTVDMADMTWVEVRSAIERGYTVAIVPTGGIEQNGAHMVLGKHDYIVRKAAGRIAQELGRTLVTPVVSFVPEGSYDPPSGNMQFPGTLGVPEPVFAQVLEGIARSLKSAGFKTICFVGDHGGNQASQAAVAAKLNAEWAAWRRPCCMWRIITWTKRRSRICVKRAKPRRRSAVMRVLSTPPSCSPSTRRVSIFRGWRPCH